MTKHHLNFLLTSLIKKRKLIKAGTHPTSEKKHGEKSMVNIEKLKAKKDIKTLIELLTHRKEKVREAACDALVALGPESFSELVMTLADRFNKKTARCLAAKALGRIRNPQTIRPLIQGLLEEEEVSRSCIKALIEFGNMSVPYLIDVIRQGGKHTLPAIYILGEIGDPNAVESLIDFIQHPDPAIRRETVVALEKIGDPAAARWLVPLLQDPYPEIRGMVAATLGKMRYIDAIPHLEQLLFDQEVTVREMAKKAIENITNNIS